VKSTNYEAFPLLPAYYYFSLLGNYVGHRKLFRTVLRKNRTSPLCVRFCGLCKEPI